MRNVKTASISFNPKVLEELDRRIEGLGLSRSVVINQLIATSMWGETWEERLKQD